MAITGITKRVACFYDNKGEYLGKKGFSKTANLFEYDDKSFNVMHDKATYTLVKRWYWNVEIYHYNINNPNPMLLDKKSEPILDSEAYNINLNTKVLRDLNNLHKGIKLTWKMALIGIGVLVLIYLLATGKLIHFK